MKKINIKKANGFAGSDALISILIITLFTGIISALLYNIYLYNSSLKRMSKANLYIIEVFEYVDKIQYDDVEKGKLKTKFNEDHKEDTEVEAIVIGEEEPSTQYKVIIDVQNYNDIEGNEHKLDLVKEITMTVKYKLGSKEQEITLKRVKSREKLVTPNRPDLNLIELAENKKIYPIKERNEQYIVCDQNDNSWYDYENEKYAMVIVTEDNMEVGDVLDIEDKENIIKYRWVPRCAVNKYNQMDIKFLYSNTNKYVTKQNEGYGVSNEGYEVLKDINEVEYNIPFEDESIGVWESTNW